MMKRDVEDVFSKKHFDLFILDEVQHLKNDQWDPTLQEK